MDLPRFLPPTSSGLLPCHGQPALFDPPAQGAAGSAAEATRQATAAAICAGCPLRSTCAQWADQQGEWGTWGGMTDADRGMDRVEVSDAKPLPVEARDACGTETARRRHMGNQEVCEVCWAARAERIRLARLARLPDHHGTRTGYVLERLLGLATCQPCRTAQTAGTRRYKQPALELAAPLPAEVRHPVAA